MKVSLFIACLLVISCNLMAQQPPPRGSFAGEVLRESGVNPGGLILELRSLNRLLPPQRVVIDEGGNFEFRDMDLGQYEVRLMDVNGTVIQEDFVTIRDGMSDWLVLRVRERPRSVPLGSGVISVQKLLHPVPSKAAKEFVLASDASGTGNLKKSIQHLEKAVLIYPEYMEAHNNLGVCWLKLAQFDKAESEFQKAIALDPTSEKPRLNLGLALFALGRYSDAQASARKALELAPPDKRGEVQFWLEKMTRTVRP